MISGPVAGSQGRLPVPMITNRDTSAYKMMARRYMAHYFAGLYRMVKDEALGRIFDWAMIKSKNTTYLKSKNSTLMNTYVMI